MIAAALAAVLAAAAPAVAAPAPAPAGIDVHRLSPRHPQVVLAQRPGDRAALVVRFAAGAADDGARPGLTRVAQHALLEANARYPYDALVREIFAADGTLQIETRIAEAAFVLEADRRDFDRLAGIVLDLVLAPSLDPKTFRLARERAINDERESSGRSDWMALIAPKVIDEGRWGNAPYGEFASIERVVLDDVQAHLRGPLSPANATVVVAGAFDARKLKARLARFTGGARPPPPPPEVHTPFSLMLPASREIYLLAFKTAFATPDATAAAQVAAALLEDRIHRVFRQRGVGYSEYVAAEHHGFLDLFLLVLPAHAPSNQPLVALLEDEVDLVRTGRFEDAELERNRAWALAQLDRIDRDPEALARQLATSAGGTWYGRAVADRVRVLDRPALERHFRELLAEPDAIRILYSPNATRRGPIPETFRRGNR